jgi:glycine C-acetyltransferase
VVEDLGFNTGMSQTPIIPLIVGESSTAKSLSDRLYEEGIFVVPIVFPMVARDLARIRVQMSAKITIEQLDSVIGAIEGIGKKLEII